MLRWEVSNNQKISVPPMIPTHMYKCVMVLLNEAATIDTLHMRPPVITTGLLP